MSEKTANILTASGNELDLLNPNPDHIHIPDIILGLSRQPRFAGQTKSFYSVAEHAMLVAKMVQNDAGPKIKLILAALFHDASEAYMGDMVGPLKVHIPVYKEIEKTLMLAIFQKLALPFTLLQEIKRYDMAALQVEQRHLFKSGSHTQPTLTPDAAAIQMTRQYNELMRLMAVITPGT